ncbi:hypothetical protein ACOSP7_029507 [Xanthoceras sorbifolium]
MSGRASRHQRRPSQSVFVNFDDLSAPAVLTDNAAAGVDMPPPTPKQQNRTPLPPSPAAAPPPAAPAETPKDMSEDKKIPTDVKN